MSEYLKKALQSAPPAGAGAPMDGYFAETYPAVWEFLTLAEIDLGDLRQKRQTATLSVFVQDALWKVFLNDRQTQQCVCVAARTFTALLEALEATLTSDEVPWRVMSPVGGTTRQKGVRKSP